MLIIDIFNKCVEELAKDLEVDLKYINSRGLPPKLRRKHVDFKMSCLFMGSYELGLSHSLICKELGIYREFTTRYVLQDHHIIPARRVLSRLKEKII